MESEKLKSESLNGPTITRRGFAAAAIGAGMSAAAVMAGCTAVQDKEDVAAEAPQPTSPKVVPASSMAQSLILAVAPKALVAVCETPYQYEDGADVTSGLPTVSSFDPDDIEGYVEMLSSFDAELILDVGRYAGDHSQAIDRLREASGAHCQLIDLSDTSFQDAVTVVASLFGVEFTDDSLETVSLISSMTRQSRLDSSEKEFSVCICSGEDGMTACGPSSGSGSFLRAVAAEPIDISASVAYSAADDTAILDSDDLLDGAVSMPDIVVLMERQAGVDYANECELGLWRVFEPGRLGYVFPGLVGGSVWLADMSPLARATLGAYWLGSLLNGCSSDEYDYDDEICSGYYRLLYGAEPEKDEDADACASLIKNKLPLSKSTHLQEKGAFENRQAEQGQAISDALDAEANRKYTVDELHEQYVALCSGFGKDATEEGFAEYLDACRAEGVVDE